MFYLKCLEVYNLWKQSSVQQVHDRTLSSHSHCLLLLRQEATQQLYRQREDDGGVLLSRDRGKGLEVSGELDKINLDILCDNFIPELKSCWWRADDVWSFLQSSGGFLLSFSFNHLCPSLSGGLSLGSHGPLQLLWQAHVLHLNSLNPGEKFVII